MITAIRRSTLAISTRAVRTNDFLYDTDRQAMCRAKHMVGNGYRSVRIVPVIARDGQQCGFYVVARNEA